MQPVRNVYVNWKPRTLRMRIDDMKEWIKIGK